MKILNQSGKIKVAIGLWVFVLIATMFSNSRSAQQFNGGAVVGVVQVTAVVPSNTPTGSPTLSPTPTGSATPTITPTVPGMVVQTPYVVIVLTFTPVCAVCTGTPTMTATPNNPYAYLLNSVTGLYDVPLDAAPSLTITPGWQAVDDTRNANFWATSIANANVILTGTATPTPPGTLTPSKTPTPTFTYNLTNTITYTPSFTATPINANVLNPPTPDLTKAPIPAVATQLITGITVLGGPTPDQTLVPAKVEATQVAILSNNFSTYATAVPTQASGIMAMNTPIYMNTPTNGLAANGIFTQNLPALTPGNTGSWYRSSRGQVYETLDGLLPTYHAMATWSPSTAANGVVWTFAGEANIIIRVKHLWVGGNCTTATLQRIGLSKYSSAPANGTVVSAPTPASVDSNDAASGALIKPYSTPCTPGTLLYNAGAFFDGQLDFDAPGVAPTLNGENFVDVLNNPSGQGAKEIYLRGTGENIGLVNTAALCSGVVLFVRVDFTRE